MKAKVGIWLVEFSGRCMDRAYRCYCEQDPLCEGITRRPFARRREAFWAWLGRAPGRWGLKIGGRAAAEAAVETCWFF